jgi:hypothetical protein
MCKWTLFAHRTRPLQHKKRKMGHYLAKKIHQAAQKRVFFIGNAPMEYVQTAKSVHIY